MHDMPLACHNSKPIAPTRLLTRRQPREARQRQRQMVRPSGTYGSFWNGW